jgi:hypothetical protein
VTAERADQHTPVDHRADVVRAGIAEIDAERFGAVPSAYPEQIVDGFGERLVPTDLFPAVRGSLERPSYAVGILLDLLETVSLGTDESLAERIEIIPANREHAVRLRLDDDSAGRFAEGASAIRTFGH